MSSAHEDVPSENEALIGPIGETGDAAPEQGKRFTLTISHEDDWAMSPSNVNEALRQYLAAREAEDAGLVEGFTEWDDNRPSNDFTSTNGVRIRASWPSPMPSDDEEAEPERIYTMDDLYDLSPEERAGVLSGNAQALTMASRIHPYSHTWLHRRNMDTDASIEGIGGAILRDGRGY